MNCEPKRQQDEDQEDDENFRIENENKLNICIKIVRVLKSRKKITWEIDDKGKNIFWATSETWKIEELTQTHQKFWKEQRSHVKLITRLIWEFRPKMSLAILCKLKQKGTINWGNYTYTKQDHI